MDNIPGIQIKRRGYYRRSCIAVADGIACLLKLGGSRCCEYRAADAAAFPQVSVRSIHNALRPGFNDVHSFDSDPALISLENGHFLILGIVRVPCLGLLLVITKSSHVFLNCHTNIVILVSYPVSPLFKSIGILHFFTHKSEFPISSIRLRVSHSDAGFHKEILRDIFRSAHNERCPIAF